MWTTEQKTLLNIIYGDDLVLVGNVVVSRDEDKKTCQLIDYNGGLLVDKPVLGIGWFIGRGGFHYVVITGKKVVESRQQSNSFVSRSATSRHYSNYLIQQGNLAHTQTKAQYTEYQYKIFSSKFEYESVGNTRKNGNDDSSTFGSITIEVGGKIVDMRINECILKEVDSARW